MIKEEIPAFKSAKNVTVCTDEETAKVNALIRYKEKFIII
jgi:hypothetical protein